MRPIGSLALGLALVSGAAQAQTTVTRQVTSEPVETVVTRGPRWRSYHPPHLEPRARRSRRGACARGRDLRLMSSRLPRNQPASDDDAPRHQQEACACPYGDNAYGANQPDGCPQHHSAATARQGRCAYAGAAADRLSYGRAACRSILRLSSRPWGHRSWPRPTWSSRTYPLRRYIRRMRATMPTAMTVIAIIVHGKADLRSRRRPSR